MHDLTFETPYEFTDSVRALLGVTLSELSDDTIMSLAIVGQAEQELYRLVPDIKTRMEDTTLPDLTIHKLMISFINLIAYYAYGPLKVSLLSSESDNKTIATRFKDALTRDPKEFKAEASKVLVEAGIIVGSSPILFTVVTPGKDVITGI